MSQQSMVSAQEQRISHSAKDVADLQVLGDAILDQAAGILRGKRPQLKVALCCLLSGGHLLVEDLPGMGKTTLARLLAKLLGLQFNRIQFTSDLLPADILGCSVYDSRSSSFTFHEGPVFTQVLLADEINRASPRTQSALLEAMAEGQVSAEGETRALPSPFFVIATQNPAEMTGTFALPESQLDRFMISLSLGYPDAASERELLQSGNPVQELSSVKPMMSAEMLVQVHSRSRAVHCSEALLDYLQRLIQTTREQAQLRSGLSPRGAIALIGCARTMAVMSGRNHVEPEDIQAVFVPVCRHRIVGFHSGSLQQNDALLEDILRHTPVL